MMLQPYAARHKSQWTDRNSMKAHHPLSPEATAPFKNIPHSERVAKLVRGIAQRLVTEDASSVRLQSALGVFCLRRETQPKATNGSRFVAARQQVAKRSMAETLRAASHLRAAAVQQSVKPWCVGTVGPSTVIQENVQ